MAKKDEWNPAMIGIKMLSDDEIAAMFDTHEVVYARDNENGYVYVTFRDRALSSLPIPEKEVVGPPVVQESIDGFVTINPEDWKD